MQSDQVLVVLGVLDRVGSVGDVQVVQVLNVNDVSVSTRGIGRDRGIRWVARVAWIGGIT